MEDLIAVATTCPGCTQSTIHHVGLAAYGRLVAGLPHSLPVQLVTGVCCNAIQEAA